MKLTARRMRLPRLVITEVSDESDKDAVLVVIPESASTAGGSYYARPKLVASNGKRRDGKPEWSQHRYNLFPIIFDGAGVPWAEANIYLLSRLEGKVAPDMETYSGIALDLAAFRQFLDETGIDWMNFPSHKLSRPTYRYNGHLKFAVAAGELKPSSAKRRMSAVIGFYRWLNNEGVLTLDHPAWKSSDRYVEYKDAKGFSQTKKVETTDVSIHIPKQNDPYDGIIEDGGRLRPLPQEEQEWLLDALISKGNTEMTLIHLFGLLTGARIQTILTFRVRHVLVDMEDFKQAELRFPVGPGTGVDTKKDKQMVLHIPVWFYQMLRTYAHSERAKKRRGRAVGGDTENQYLFLSVRGTPLYSSKEESRVFDETNERRHAKSGQVVRQFIADSVIPFVSKKYGVKDFHFQFHDTRATYGMNLTDHQLKLVEDGKTTLMNVREFVKTRMGHNSALVTDRYLQFRQNLKHVRWVGGEHETHIRKLAQQTIEGLL